MDIKDKYLIAETKLTEELGREPSLEEVEELVQTMIDNELNEDIL